MLGTVCKGLHCAGCKPQFTLPGPVVAVILCLMFRHTIGVILTDLIEAAAIFAGAVTVSSMIVYPLLMRVLMPPGSTRNAILYTSDPARFFGAVGRHSGREGGSESPSIPDAIDTRIYVPSSVEVLYRQTHARRQGTGQFELPKGRD